MKDINNLIEFYNLKLNLVNRKALEDKLLKYKEVIKSYEKQIDFQKEKELGTTKQLKNLEINSNKLDLERLKQGHSNDLNERRLDSKNKKTKIILIEKLVEEVDSGLHENKHATLTEHLIAEEKLRKLHKKIMKYDEYGETFKQVKVEAKKIIEKKLERETIKDFKVILEKLGHDQVILKVN